MSVSKTILNRHSVRDFESTPVSVNLISDILNTAKYSPSNCNHQPWNVYILTDKIKEDLSQAIIDSFERSSCSSSYPYLPKKWIYPFSKRRKDIGSTLYNTIGIEYEDKEKINDHYKRNFKFYGAPIGLIFTINNTLEYGSFLDYGMFLQNILLLSEEKGLSTCTIGFFTEYPDPIQQTLNLNKSDRIVCGMAVGYKKQDSIINTVRSEREPLSSFVHIL